jgi:hypothetical protein
VKLGAVVSRVLRECGIEFGFPTLDAALADLLTCGPAVTV